MAEENEIRVVITGVASDLRRALEGAKGDLGGLRDKIKDVPNQIKIDVQAETAAAMGRLGVLKKEAAGVKEEIKIKADADTGVAEAKLKLLNQGIRNTETEIARAQLGLSTLSAAMRAAPTGGGGGGGANLLGSLFTGGPGIGPLGTLGSVAAAPLAAAGIGSAGALVGSAGAGILGAGALGTSGLGALLAGIGPLIALSGGLKDAIKLSGQLEQAQKNLASAQAIYGGQNKALTTAQNNYNAAVAAFGPSSNAARSAHAQLLLAQQKQVAIAPQITSAQNALTKLQLQANPAVLAFAASWGKVSDALQSAEQAILPAFATALRPVLDTFTALLPTLVQMAKIDLSGISAFLKPLLEFVNSATFKAALIQLADTFARLGGPLGQAFTSLLRAFLNVAIAAAPFLVQIADAFARWARSFADSLTPGQHLTTLISGLVGQLRSWWDLAKAVGGLMVTVFSAGAGTGKTLVDQLTTIVGKWNAWLNTKAGQDALRRFFSDSASLLKAVLSTLAPIVALIGSLSIGLIPTMTTLLKPLAELLATISQFVNGLASHLPGVLKALPGLAVAVGVLASWKGLQAVVAATVALAGTKVRAAVGLGAAESAAGGAASAEGAAGGAAAGISRFVLPVAIGATVIAGFVALGNAINGPRGVNQALSNLKAQMAAAIAAGDVGKLARLSDAVRNLGQQLRDDGTKGAQAFLDLAGVIDRSVASMTLNLGAKLGGALGNVQTQFKIMAGDAGQSLKTITTQVVANTQTIKETIDTNTTAGRLALATNFALAATDVRLSMQSGVINTKQGLAAIDSLMRQALKSLGGDALAVSNFLANVGPGVVTQQQLVASGAISQGAANSRHASGGLVQVGRPGERGRDTVPMSVGGQSIVVGAGEQVAVFNAEQQQVMNARLADMGGLPGMFAKHNRPHYMAAGGFLGYSLPLPRSQMMPGSWSIDQGVDIPAPAGTPEFAIGPGQITQEGVQGFGPNAPVLRISSGPLAGRSVYYGHAGPDRVPTGAQVTAGQQISEVGAGIVGISTGPHIEIGFGPPFGRGDGMAAVLRELLSGAGVTGVGLGGAGGGPAWTNIAVPKWTGPGGAIGAIGRAVLAKVTAAANAFGAAHAPSAGAAGSLGPMPNAGDWQGELSGIAKQHGWNVGDWMALVQGESGGNPTARNPSSGAFGLGQFLGATAQQYASLGATSSDPKRQIGAMAQYIADRYGNPTNAYHTWLSRSPHWYELGGLVGAARGLAPRAAKPRPASKPPKAPKHTHPKTHSKYAPFIPKDALKGLLDPNQLKPDKMAAGYDRQVTVADQTFSNLLASQVPVDDPALATLTDADVAALDPTGALGYEAGDQIVNRDGMTVGRFFGPGGAIQGGSFHPGATTRLAELAAILTNRRSRLTSLYNEEGAERAAVGVDRQAIGKRLARRGRIERYLHASVRRAGVVKAELDVLRSKDLARALRDALSKQAIGKRLTGLRGHLRKVTDELGAEQRSQAAEPALARDPTHANALRAQAQGLRDSIAVESELGRSGSAAVERAKSAIYAHDLTTQLSGLEATNRTLGGSPLVAGTGGVIKTITDQVKTIATDRDTRQNTLADFLQTQLIPAKTEIASYVKEQTDISKLANIQVRTPAAAAGPDLSALNQLLTTQLQTTQQALALSDAQFGVLQGFAPLLQGRLVGSFASGIDFVPHTGLALVHRGEVITPDPGGPYGNRAAAATVQSAQGPVEVNLYFENDQVPLVRLVRGEMNQHALQITSDHAGQRARLMAGVRRP